MDANELLTTKIFAVKKDQVLFSPGEKYDCFYLIVKGKIQIYKLHSNGSTLEYTLNAGTTLGEVEFLLKEEFPYQAKAAEDCNLLEIDSNTIDLFIASFPQYVMNILKKLSKDLKALNEEMEMAVGEKNSSEDRPTRGKTDIVEIEKYYHIESDKKYPMLLPEVHDEYVYPKEVECPICEKTFMANQIRSSKLQMDRVDKDFRRHYKDFDELWYQLWRCPRCGYTNFQNEFFKIGSNAKKNLFECLPRNEFPSELRIIKRDINQVLADYFHFNKLVSFYNMDSTIKVRLWQSLAWLLEDVKDKEAAYKARRVLKVMIEDCWYSSRVITQQEDECKLTIKLAFLCKEEGLYNDARKYLLSLSKLKNVPNMMRNLIQDEVLELKNLSKNEQNVE